MGCSGMPYSTIVFSCQTWDEVNWVLGCLSFSVLDNFLILGTTYTHFIHISPNIVSFFSSQGVGWFLILFYVYKSTGSFLIARTSLYHNISLYQLFCAALPHVNILLAVLWERHVWLPNRVTTTALVWLPLRRWKDPKPAYTCIFHNYTHQLLSSRKRGRGSEFFFPQ